MCSLSIYLLSLVALAIVFSLKRWHHLNRLGLAAQPLFWVGIGVPVYSFLFFGWFAWTGRHVDMSATGFNEFVLISKLPLGFLSLSIPISAIVASAHRATQIAAQVEAVLEKNAIDRFYAHEKAYIDKFRSLDFGETDIFNDEKRRERFAVEFPHRLYRAVYPHASARQDADYSPNTAFEFLLREKVKGVSDALWTHVEGIEQTGSGPPASREIEEIYVVLLMVYEVFDHVGIGNISSTYFYVQGTNCGLQLNIGSEYAFKRVLQFMLKASIAVTDIVSSAPLEGISGIHRYAFTLHSHFATFQDAKAITACQSTSWRDAVKLFRSKSVRGPRPSASSEFA